MAIRRLQGDWGEMLLGNDFLDSSALSKGIHYQTQYNIKDEEGAQPAARRGV